MEIKEIKMAPAQVIEIGSVSTATMRTEDLIPTFCDVLEHIGTEEDKVEVNRIRKEIDKTDHLCRDDLVYSDGNPYWDSDESGFDLEELFDRLNEHAPPYCYFGAHEGDGSDYGFWVSWDSIEDDSHFGELLKVNDLSHVTLGQIDEYEYIALVNDHGNVTLYSTADFNTDQFKEVWAIV
jgi:hypothetical protein